MHSEIGRPLFKFGSARFKKEFAAMMENEEIYLLRKMCKEKDIQLAAYKDQNSFLKQKLLACQKLLRDFEEVQRLLSMSGDNPIDYMPELMEQNNG